MAVFLQERPIVLLVLTFVVWKAIVFALVCIAPGPGYDTSTTLLDAAILAPDQQGTILATADSVRPTILKFVRWDAIYFTQIARRGHEFEQEWAFGLGLSTPISAISRALSQSLDLEPHLSEIAVAIALSHVAHLLAVLLLFTLSQNVMRNTTTALVAACLHIFSPAGAFLSAPYAESLFAFLQFAAFALYFSGLRDSWAQILLIRDVKILLSGLIFGMATIVRSNGILSGLPLFADFTLVLISMIRSGTSAKRFRILAVLVIAGCMIAVGAILPQYVAYTEYCQGPLRHERRPWCGAWPPSVFTFVQAHYWKVGLFKYWTMSNLPLFLLALPCLWVLFASSRWAAKTYNRERTFGDGPNGEDLLRLAMPQTILAVAALTTYHVQIINRLASGYPLWYIWLAHMITKPTKQDRGTAAEDRTKARLIVRSMLTYAVVQGGLFASFLPPA